MSHSLPPQAIFSSVLPGEYMSGHLAAQIEFPAWFGKNSRRNKFDRLTQELQMHMRLRYGRAYLSELVHIYVSTDGLFNIPSRQIMSVM